jgi:O-antigen/teichoic acid export membrane protein
MVSSVLLTMLLGRHLAPEDLGFFALVGTVFVLAHELTDLGTGSVAAREAARAAGSERRTLESLLGFRLILCAAMAVACVGLALSQSSPPRLAILLAAAGVVLLLHVGALNTVFQLRQAQGRPALVLVATQFATLGAAALMIAFEAAGVLFATLAVARELAVLGCNSRLAIRLLGYVPRLRVGLGTLRRFAGRTGAFSISALLFNMQFQGSTFFIEWVRPETELGAFAAAFRPVAALLGLPWLLMLPLVPVLSHLAAADRKAFRRQAAGTLRLAVGVGSVVVVAGTLLAPAVLRFLYGGRFIDGPLSAVTAFRWLSVALGCSCVTAAAAIALMSDERDKELLQLSGVGLMLGVAANLVLLPLCGFTGGAVATAVAGVATALGTLTVLRRGSEGLVLGRHALLFLAPAFLLFAALQLVPETALLRLAVGAALSGAALFGLWSVPEVAAYRAEQARLSTLGFPVGGRQAGRQREDGG